MFNSSPEHAQDKAEQLVQNISEINVAVPTASVRATAAWGVAACDGERSAEDILEAADAAMYANKPQANPYMRNIPKRR
jgi:PleD family two-component response regulator